MTADSTDSLLGIGIYTAAEAAMYARVPTARMTRWILGTSRHRPAIVAQLDPTQNADRWVTFLDFIQSMAIREILRTKPGISLETIRETIEMATEKFDTPYPFARKHTTHVRGNELVLDIDGVIIEATGPHKNQLAIRKVVERYLEDVSFDASGLAAKYVAFTWEGYDIVLNPRIRFGEPIVSRPPKSKVKPCRYSVKTLCDAFDAEGSYKGASLAYGVSEAAVKAARKYYYDYLQTREAA